MAGGFGPLLAESGHAFPRESLLLRRPDKRLEHRGNDDAGSSADRYQVVVHVDQAVLTQAVEADERCFRGSVVAAREPDASFEETLRIHVLNFEAGLTIDAKTSRCRWLGESMDYSQAIEGMQFLRDRDAALQRPGASP